MFHGYFLKLHPLRSSHFLPIFSISEVIEYHQLEVVICVSAEVSKYPNDDNLTPDRTNFHH